ncbi:NAD(P)/FAD-dependent oxidoreductase [Pararhizobium mangrovi]|uniref:FAD-binding oxidoreductase n=1 Tax=Pararhizobium mangrovi TaxID=2590452 RepID=A0A506U321_9HYPH|nr:FAD-binding oxidoreductase [Pararhizobium mangrovi]TPW27424.1 FAD-binding oxidoreductase [Pararhizobium mangrovi]
MAEKAPLTSLWAETATPAFEASRLVGDHEADVAVVGGGFTGLTTALALAEGGASVVLLEAERIGFGASGRNGGQVIPGLKHDPDAIDAAFGEETTDFVGRTADTVFELIERHGIDCAPVRRGWIQGTIKNVHLAKLRTRMEEWQRRGVAARWLDAAAIEKATGSPTFVAGWHDPRAGTIQPLSYAHGLARAAEAAGARLHAESRVTDLRRNGSRWTLRCAKGSVRAESVVLATNGYTDGLWPKLKATALPANSFQIATAPLSAEELERVLPEGCPVSETRRIGNYFRFGPGNRLLMGGRGSFRDPRTSTDFKRIVGALHHFFPDLRGKKIDHHWWGRVAMTADSLPHIHRPAPGLIMALGFNGRGVALSSALGTAIGKHLLDEAHPLPLATSPIRPLPVHALHRWYGTGAITYYRLRDALDR